MILDINGFKVLLIHGHQFFKGDNQMKYFYDKVIKIYKNFDLCLFGHSHVFLDEKYKGKRFVNPGSIGQPTDSNTYKYVIIDFGDTVNLTLREFNVLDSINELEESIKNSDYYKESPVWTKLILDTIRDGYDHCCEFIDLLNENDVNDLSEEDFNRKWDEAFEKYKNAKNSPNLI